MKRNILLRIEYLGSDFSGWQIQKGRRTVQGVLNEKLRLFLKVDLKPLGSGRTDAGVHALSQFANFATTSPMAPDMIMHKLDRMLPDDIVITGCSEVPPSFNARRDATERSYRYLVCERKSAVNRGLAWVLGRRLDLEMLGRMASAVKASRHFHNFCKIKSRKGDNRCRITKSRWSRRGGLLQYEIAADRFLHNMVRLLVGSMVAVAVGKMEISRFMDQLKKDLDDKTKHIAPPDGLYLAGVTYEGISL